jgi:hypothetical protein
MIEDIATNSTHHTAGWNGGSAEGGASFHADTGCIVIGRSTPREGRADVRATAEGFFADVPDLDPTCDGVRIAGDHSFLWTFACHPAETRDPLRMAGWEAWDMDADGKVAASEGWFDAEDHARQVAG